MLARRSLGEGGSIARRRSPGRNCRRACRAAVAFHVVGILTPRSQEPFSDFNAKPQRPRDAKTITNDKSSITNSQYRPFCFFSVLLFKVFGCDLSGRSFASWRYRFPVKVSSAKISHCLPFQPLRLLCECHCDPVRIPKTLKNPSNCCNLRPVAATCQCDHEHRNIPQPSRPNRRPTAAIHPAAPFHHFPLFSSFSTLISALCQPGRNAQPIAPKPLATQSDGPIISKTFQLSTLF